MLELVQQLSCKRSLEAENHISPVLGRHRSRHKVNPLEDWPVDDQAVTFLHINMMFLYWFSLCGIVFNW